MNKNLFKLKVQSQLRNCTNNNNQVRFYSKPLNVELTNNNLKTNTVFKHIAYTYSDFKQQKFVESLMVHLPINSNYTILVKFGFKNNSDFYMSGEQIGIKIGNFHKIESYKNIYNIISYRLESVMDNYDFDYYPDTIIVSYKNLTLFEELITSNIKKIKIENKSIFSRKDLTKIFSKKYLPLTLNSKYYGYLIQERLKTKYINKLISNILNQGLEVPEFFKNKDLIKKSQVFIDNKKYKNVKLTKVIISCNIKDYNKSSEHGFIRMVFDLNTGICLYKVLDLISDNKVFTRKINNYTINIENNKVREINRTVNLDFIKPPKYSYSPISNPNIGVLDIETFVNSQGLGQVYCLGYVTLSNIDNIKTFYLSDLGPSLNSNLLIINCINSMLEPKYNNYYWYIHNMGKFDMVYIYKTLEDYNLNYNSQYYKLETRYKDGKMLRLVVKCKINSKYVKITFIDSLNILSGSLDTLTKDFKVNYLKGHFPYSFVNENNLTYIGQTPSISYYNSISLSEYNKIYSENSWSLKAETIKYIKQDLLGLLELLDKFKSYLFIEHNVEMTQGLTISRLALNKFIFNYLNDSKIPLITKLSIFDFIYKGYYGGRTEVFKPYGKNLFYYDMNSQYPNSSLNNMPGMKVSYTKSFTSDGLDINNIFGVFRAIVKTNDNILGLLPVKTQLGLIFPNGEFEGIWPSPELKFAKENGYQVKIIEGYNFNEVPSYFRDYVLDLYELKSNTRGSERLINKSLLNNLLGRFGLNIIKPVSNIVNNKNLDYLLSTRKIKTIQEINSNTYLVNYIPIVDTKICMEHGLDYMKVLMKNNNFDIEKNIDVFEDVSVIVSAMVTSYARVSMLKIMLAVIEAGGTIYYCDTDSIVTDIPIENIDPNLVGPLLGQFKLEYYIKEAYFISNKTYCLVLNDDTTIIKCKGIKSNSISLDDFKSMYYLNKNISATKSTTVTNLSKGSVIIKDKDILLAHDVYKKRDKIYNTQGLWVNTKPLLYNNKQKALVLYNNK